jgi:hypothetical protein
MVPRATTPHLFDFSEGYAEGAGFAGRGQNI